MESKYSFLLFCMGKSDLNINKCKQKFRCLNVCSSSRQNNWTQYWTLLNTPNPPPRSEGLVCLMYFIVIGYVVTTNHYVVRRYVVTNTAYHNYYISRIQEYSKKIFLFQRNIIRYRNFLTKSLRKEVVLKQLEVNGVANPQTVTIFYI